MYPRSLHSHFSFPFGKYLMLFFCLALVACEENAVMPSRKEPTNLEAVDLGLPSGTLWASMNLGAETPEQYGDYFAWGERRGFYTGKKHFIWDTYSLCRGDFNKLKKYCTDATFGTVDNKTTLELCDDAAHALWGNRWRIPTADEWLELCNCCSVERTTQNGVVGQLFSSPNGNSVFLPAAGYCCDSTLAFSSARGCYWSASLCADQPDGAMAITCFRSGVELGYFSRYCGLSVRPVSVSPAPQAE